MYDEYMTEEDKDYFDDLDRLLDKQTSPKYTADGLTAVTIKNLFIDFADSAPFTWICLRTKEWNNFEVRFDFNKETTPEELAERIVNYYTRHLALMETFEKP